MDEIILLNQLELLEAAEQFENIPERSFWSTWVKDIDVFERLSNSQFIKLFRLSKELVMELIEELDDLLTEPTRKSAIPKHLKVLIALNFYGSGSYQTSVGFNKFLAVSQSTVSRAINEVSEALNNPRVLNKWVNFSLNEEYISEMRTRFYEAYGIPGIVGVIDCTHVAIFPPAGNEHIYVNRKHYHSINTQLVCDIDLKILNINAKFPGSTHDAFIWNSSHISNVLENASENNQFKGYLIGDSGYPLRRWLQTPISNAEDDSPEQGYNSQFLRARCLIERCNGLLKMRFRCLLKHRVLHYTPVTAGKIINACSVLHNICVENKLPEPEEEEEDNVDFGMYPCIEVQNPLGNEGILRNPQLEAGRRLQRHIVNNYF